MFVCVCVCACVISVDFFPYSNGSYREIVSGFIFISVLTPHSCFLSPNQRTNSVSNVTHCSWPLLRIENKLQLSDGLFSTANFFMFNDCIIIILITISLRFVHDSMHWRVQISHFNHGFKFRQMLTFRSQCQLRWIQHVYCVPSLWKNSTPEMYSFGMSHWVKRTCAYCTVWFTAVQRQKCTEIDGRKREKERFLLKNIFLLFLLFWRSIYGTIDK